MVFRFASLVIAGHEIKEIPTIAGIGTIITAFFMGPLIDFFNNKIAIPFLNRGRKESAVKETSSNKPADDNSSEI